MNFFKYSLILDEEIIYEYVLDESFFYVTWKKVWAKS